MKFISLTFVFLLSAILWNCSEYNIDINSTYDTGGIINDYAIAVDNAQSEHKYIHLSGIQGSAATMKLAIAECLVRGTWFGFHAGSRGPDSDGTYVLASHYTPALRDWFNKWIHDESNPNGQNVAWLKSSDLVKFGYKECTH